MGYLSGLDQNLSFRRTHSSHAVKCIRLFRPVVVQYSYDKATRVCCVRDRSK